MNLKSLLSRYTVDQLKEAIRLGSTYGRVNALEEKKAALLKQVAKIDRKLAKLTGNGAATTASKPGRKPGRKRGYKLSAATRAKMRAAALRRYGKGKPEEPKPRRKWRMSAEGRQRIADAARRRWAAIKAAKETPRAETKA